MTLHDFIELYPPKPPRKQAANADENRLLGKSDGVLLVGAPPLETSKRAHPSAKEADLSRHLWVFRAGDEPEPSIPAILERAVVNPPLESGKVKHSNLTGGGKASCGGELWVDPTSPQRLYVNGASGRYGPRTEKELADAVAVFSALGFEAVSFGWDDNAPARFYRES